jgi:hypothetical protein
VTVREVKGGALPKRTKIEITVGVHAAEAGSSHGEGLTVGDIGSFHEFGTATIPQRSFIRGWYDERQAFIADTLRTQLQAVIAGKRPIEQAAERIALAFEGDVKRRIAQNIPPPLAPATIARKGSSVALIDTGQLRNAIRGQVKIG